MKMAGTDTDVHFGEISGAEVDWRSQEDEEDDDPDDEELEETPPDVVAVLGFDPLEVDTDEEPSSALRGAVQGAIQEAKSVEEMRSVLTEAFRYYP